MRFFSILTLLLTVTASSLARPGATWLEIGPGARAAALAEAVVASPNSPSGAWWNPAGAGMDGGGVELMQASWWVDGTTAQHLSATFETGRVGWGVSLHHVGVAGMELRTGPSAAPIDHFDSRNFSLGGTVATTVYRNLRLGLSARYLSEDIYIYHANGWSMDAGLLWTDAVSGALDLGAAVRHLGHIEGLSTQGEELPTTVSAGLRYRLPLKLNNRPSLLVEAAKVNGLATSMRLGEVRVLGVLDIRAGWRSGYEGQSLSAGFGLTWRQWGLDFGYTPFEDNLGDVQRFSLRAAW